MASNYVALFFFLAVMGFVVHDIPDPGVIGVVIFLGGGRLDLCLHEAPGAGTVAPSTIPVLGHAHHVSCAGSIFDSLFGGLNARR